MVLIEPGATHALLVAPDMGIAAVRLDDCPPADPAEESGDARDERSETVDVVQDVDTEDDTRVGVHAVCDVALAEAQVLKRPARPGHARVRPRELGQNVAGTAAELDDEVAVSGARSDIDTHERRASAGDVPDAEPRTRQDSARNAIEYDGYKTG